MSFPLERALNTLPWTTYIHATLSIVVVIPFSGRHLDLQPVPIIPKSLKLNGIPLETGNRGNLKALG
jgi:hypothetical protein